jgi:hypothetical protein
MTEENHETPSARIASVTAEIRSGHLWITSLEDYCYANLLGDTVHVTWP